MKEATKEHVSNDARLAQHPILRIADAIEDAPYEFESPKVIDARLVASCSQDFENPGGYRAQSKKRSE